MAEWLALRNVSVYTVKKGDTLTGISARFNVPYKALTIWNPGGSRKLTPGEKLFVFSDTLKSGGATDKTDEPAP